VDTQHLDAIQTAGILFIGIVIAYVVWRLEMAIKAGLGEIKLMLIAQKQTLDAQSAIADMQTTTATRLTQVESHIETLAKRIGEVEKAKIHPARPARPRKPKPPAIKVNWLQGTK